MFLVIASVVKILLVILLNSFLYFNCVPFSACMVNHSISKCNIIFVDYPPWIIQALTVPLGRDQLNFKIGMQLQVGDQSLKERKWINGWEGGWMEGIFNIPRGYVGGSLQSIRPYTVLGHPPRLPRPQFVIFWYKINKQRPYLNWYLLA